MLLWFYLLKQDAVRANNWLFMTPISGYIVAAIFLNESITIFDVTATVFVITGLLLSGNIAIHPISIVLSNSKEGRVSPHIHKVKKFVEFL